MSNVSPRTVITPAQAYRKGWDASKRTVTCDLDAAITRFLSRNRVSGDGAESAFADGWSDYAVDRYESFSQAFGDWSNGYPIRESEERDARHAVMVDIVADIARDMRKVEDAYSMQADMSFDEMTQHMRAFYVRATQAGTYGASIRADIELWADDMSYLTPATPLYLPGYVTAYDAPMTRESHSTTPDAGAHFMSLPYLLGMVNAHKASITAGVDVDTSVDYVAHALADIALYASPVLAPSVRKGDIVITGERGAVDGYNAVATVTDAYAERVVYNGRSHATGWVVIVTDSTDNASFTVRPDAFVSVLARGDADGDVDEYPTHNDGEPVASFLDAPVWFHTSIAGAVAYWETIANRHSVAFQKRRLWAGVPFCGAARNVQGRYVCKCGHATPWADNGVTADAHKDAHLAHAFPMSADDRAQWFAVADVVESVEPRFYLCHACAVAVNNGDDSHMSDHDARAVSDWMTGAGMVVVPVEPTHTNGGESCDACRTDIESGAGAYGVAWDIADGGV